MKSLLAHDADGLIHGQLRYPGTVCRPCCLLLLLDARCLDDQKNRNIWFVDETSAETFLRRFAGDHNLTITELQEEEPATGMALVASGPLPS